MRAGTGLLKRRGARSAWAVVNTAIAMAVAGSVAAVSACAPTGTRPAAAVVPGPSNGTGAASTTAVTSTPASSTATTTAATTTTSAMSTTTATTESTRASTTTAAMKASTTAASATAASPTAPTTAPVPVVLDEDVAALPDGHGATLAIVVDDVGGVEGSLAEYLALPTPIDVSVIPSFAHATEHAERAHAAGKEVLLHLPLANRRGHGDGVTRLNGTEPPAVVDAFVQAAVDRVPYAVGANNHEGPYGSAQRPLMRSLLGALQQRGLFFLDSVTSQRSVGYSVEGELGMARRVNNQFLDHDETDENSRAALLHLAVLAAASGSGIGICHVYHPYALHALQAIGAQLSAKGYVFAPLSAVTNRLQGGLDAGMKA